MPAGDQKSDVFTPWCSGRAALRLCAPGYADKKKPEEHQGVKYALCTAAGADAVRALHPQKEVFRASQDASSLRAVTVEPSRKHPSG